MQIPHAARAWTLSGTPADCVKFAFAKLLDVRPDLVVGGINPSPNMATEVLYSGTVAAAIEGCLHGIPSIAMSQNSSKFDRYNCAVAKERFSTDHDTVGQLSGITIWGDQGLCFCQTRMAMVQ